jgi:hypothetical protein
VVFLQTVAGSMGGIHPVFDDLDLSHDEHSEPADQLILDNSRQPHGLSLVQHSAEMTSVVGAAITHWKSGETQNALW